MSLLFDKVGDILPDHNFSCGQKNVIRKKLQSKHSLYNLFNNNKKYIKKYKKKIVDKINELFFPSFNLKRRLLFLN